MEEELLKFCKRINCYRYRTYGDDLGYDDRGFFYCGGPAWKCEYIFSTGDLSPESPEKVKKQYHIIEKFLMIQKLSE